MPASYNQNNIDYTGLIPRTDPLLRSAVVRTRLGEQSKRRQTFIHPSLDGAGAFNFGRAIVPIEWELDLVASPGSPASLANARANLALFLAKIRPYLETSRAYALIDEYGVTRNNVELITLEEVAAPVYPATLGIFARFRLRFEWMRPT